MQTKNEKRLKVAQRHYQYTILLSVNHAIQNIMQKEIIRIIKNINFNSYIGVSICINICIIKDKSNIKKENQNIFSLVSRFIQSPYPIRYSI